MTPAESACRNLNRLLADEPEALYSLMCASAVVSQETAEAPHVYVGIESAPANRPVLRMLGVVNGILAPFGEIVVGIYEERILTRFEVRAPTGNRLATTRSDADAAAAGGAGEG